MGVSGLCEQAHTCRLARHGGCRGLRCVSVARTQGRDACANNGIGQPLFGMVARSRGRSNLLAFMMLPYGGQVSG